MRSSVARSKTLIFLYAALPPAAAAPLAPPVLRVLMVVCWLSDLGKPEAPAEAEVVSGESADDEPNAPPALDPHEDEVPAVPPCPAEV